MSFQESTRLRRIRPTVMTRPAGGGQTTSFDLPKVGLLTRLYLHFTITIAGTVTTQNQYGVCSAVNNIALRANSGLDIVNITGPGAEYLLRDVVDLMSDTSPQSQGRSTLVTATTYTFDVVLPISLNDRDETGLILLQNEQTLTTIYVAWESDANVILTGGGTISAATCEVYMDYFEIPNNPKDMPDLSIAHTLREDKTIIPAAGDVTYVIPRGNILAGVYHLIGTTTYSRVILRAQQGNNIVDDNVASQRMVFNSLRSGRDLSLSGTALTGANFRYFHDFLAPDGLGAYGSRRDYIDTSLLTDLASIVTVAGAGELRTMRRELIPLRA